MAATVTMQDKNDRKIFIRKRSKPEIKACEIYDALGYKYYLWVRKSVLSEKKNQKNEPPENRESYHHPPAC
jgi:hypothetical protein